MLSREPGREKRADLVDGLDDPIDTGITTDGFVLRVNENDLKVFVCRILVDPVGV